MNLRCFPPESSLLYLRNYLKLTFNYIRYIMLPLILRQFVCKNIQKLTNVDAEFVTLNKTKLLHLVPKLQLLKGSITVGQVQKFDRLFSFNRFPTLMVTAELRIMLNPKWINRYPSLLMCSKKSIFKCR